MSRPSLTPRTVTVTIASECYTLAEPTYRELLDIQRELAELADAEATAPDDPTAGLGMVALIMRRADGWAARWPDDESLLELRPSDVRAVMAAWGELLGETGEAQGEGSFRG